MNERYVRFGPTCVSREGGGKAARIATNTGLSRNTPISHSVGWR